LLDQRHDEALDVAWLDLGQLCAAKERERVALEIASILKP
jgi:hypothetical protein